MLASLLGGDRLLKSLDLFVNRPDVDAAGYRRLRADEVSQLERTFNTSPNWGDILVAVDFDGISRVRGCHFDGRIFLNSFLSDINIGNGIYLPSGLLNSNFKGCCFLDLDCIVRNTTVVCNVVMGRCSCLLDCGAVLCEGSSAFGNGEVVLLGPENCGGRKVPIFVGADYGDLCRLALDRKNRGLRIATDINCSEAVCAVKLAFSVLGEHAQLVRNDMIKNVILGPYCSISSSSLCSCTVVSSESAPAIISSGSYITACILSGSNKVKGPCEIQHSMLMDCAAVSTGALVSHCIVGPDSSVGGAECLHSIIGPFTGVHHASLVISCMWPTGRGNVAYGAMAANHTGRLNDQEGLSGEGCFYGLGVQLKYPFNTLSAPYSLFAGRCSHLFMIVAKFSFTRCHAVAGTICLPQRIAFPFSLISSSDVPISVEVSNASFSPALNVIRPGWVIYSSPYTLVR